MALLPLFFDDFRPARHDLTSLLLRNLLDDDLVTFRGRTTPLTGKSVPAEISEDDNFRASIDVQQFKPEEITVKLTDDNTVTVEGKHEEREDEHGYVSRHFVRKYVLPEGYDAEKVQSKLSSDGVLNIVAPKKPEGKKLEYREIPITLTGPVKSLGHKLQQKLEKVKPKRLIKKGGHK